jgi:hypothetical protein
LLHLLFFHKSILLFLALLVGDFGFGLELAEPAEEQRVYSYALRSENGGPLA